MKPQKLDLLLSALCGLLVGGAFGFLMGASVAAQINWLATTKMSDQKMDDMLQVYMVGGAVIMGIVFAAMAHAVNKIIQAINSK